MVTCRIIEEDGIYKVTAHDSETDMTVTVSWKLTCKDAETLANKLLELGQVHTIEKGF